MGSTFLSGRLFINGSNVSYNTLSGAPLFKFAILIHSFQEKEPSIALTYAFFNLEFVFISDIDLLLVRLYSSLHPVLQHLYFGIDTIRVRLSTSHSPADNASQIPTALM